MSHCKVYNIENILEWFLKSNDAENAALPTQEYIIFWNNIGWSSYAVTLQSHLSFLMRIKEFINSIQFKFICIALFTIQSLQSALQEIKFLQYIYTL